MRTVSATPTPETPVKTEDHSDKYNSGADEDHSAKAAPAATAAAGEDSVKVTDKPPERDSNKDSVDTDDEETNLDMPSKAESGGQCENAMAGSEEEVVTGRPPQSVASCRLSARHIFKKAILQAHLSKTTRSLMIYKGRHIFSPLSMPGTLSDCGGLVTGGTKCKSPQPRPLPKQSPPQLLLQKQ
jgi:hypothetical protein